MSEPMAAGTKDTVWRPLIFVNVNAATLYAPMFHRDFGIQYYTIHIPQNIHLG